MPGIACGEDDDPKLLHLLADVRQSIVGKEQGEEVNEIAAKVEAAFRKYWESPPTEAMEIVLRKRMVDDETRQILFHPSEEDMAHYEKIILSAPENSPKEHPCNKLQPIAVPLLYLAHSHKWKLAKAFMLNGGLPALITLFEEENLYLRSQAVETFSRLTDKEAHMDWMDLNDGNDLLRTKLFQLSGSCGIIKALIANMRGSYPGGGFSCLRLLAFWLSWVRALYCPDKRLRVSQKILDALLEWSTCEEASGDEERGLAKVLYDDFNRLPVAEAGFGPDQCGLDGAREKTADDVRVEGNDHWKQGNIQGAIDSYTRAIGMGNQGQSDTASLLNRAMARLKLSPPDFEGALKDSDQAIAGGDEDNPKAHYRRAVALEGLVVEENRRASDMQLSAERLDVALLAAAKAKKLSGGDSGVAEVHARIEKKLNDEREKFRLEMREKEKDERGKREKEREEERRRKAQDVDELD